MPTVETWDAGQEDSFVNQDILLTTPLGGSAGGSFANIGSVINYLTFYSNQHSSSDTAIYLQGLGVGYDDGSSITIGSINSNNYQVPVALTINLTQDTIRRFYIAQISDDNDFGGDGTGVAGVYIETVRGKTYISSNKLNTPYQNPKGWTLVTDNDSGQAVANIVLVGVMGRYGAAVDQLGFYYKQDMLLNQAITNVAYNDGAWTISSPSMLNVATATVSNQTGQAQQMSITFQESVASSYTFSATAGITVGASADFQCGFPFVAEGRVTVSTEVSFSATIGYAKTVSEAFSYTATVAVAPGTSVKATAQATSHSISGSFSAKLSELWAHAGAVTSSINGTISGISAYDVTVSYAPA